MVALPKMPWSKKTDEKQAKADETKGETAPLAPQQIPSFEELAEVLPNLKRTLR